MDAEKNTRKIYKLEWESMNKKWLIVSFVCLGVAVVLAIAGYLTDGFSSFTHWF